MFFVMFECHYAMHNANQEFTNSWMTSRWLRASFLYSLHLFLSSTSKKSFRKQTVWSVLTHNKLLMRGLPRNPFLNMNTFDDKSFLGSFTFFPK